MKIGIIGNGYVGKATSNIIPSSYEKVVYDIDPNKCEPSGISFKDVDGSDIIFVCVPTPMYRGGRCYTKVVEDSILKIRRELTKPCTIIIRSTVPVGTSYKIDVNFMPEFLTEANWEKDTKETTDWILGVSDVGNSKFKQLIELLLEDSVKEKKISGSKIHFMDTKTAELTKYTSNAFFATKVGFFNEINDFCEKEDISYSELLDALIPVSRGRISPSHTQVPGPDGKKGFGGTCLPKDIAALQYLFLERKMQPIILRAVDYRNKTKDRPEKDWEKDKGRASL